MCIRLLMAICLAVGLLNLPISTTTASTSDFLRLEVTGHVPARCGLHVDPFHSTNKSLALNLSRNAPWQQVAAISVECNTGQSNALVTYESANQGLKHVNGSILDYQMNVTGYGARGNRNASEGPMLIQQRVGRSISFLRVKPISSGLEEAGQYADVINITVSAQ